MRLDVLEQRWQQEGAAILSGFREWWVQHPRATLSEIEAALDERLAQLRVRLLEDAARGTPPLTLRRHYAGCPAPATRRCSPLDEELVLLPGPLTPRLQESAVRLGAGVPFPV